MNFLFQFDREESRRLRYSPDNKKEMCEINWEQGNRFDGFFLHLASCYKIDMRSYSTRIASSRGEHPDQPTGTRKNFIIC